MNTPRITAPAIGGAQGTLRILFLFTLLLEASCYSKPISTMPDFTLLDVHGGEFHLHSQPAQPLLLAFLQTIPDTVDTPSRRQVVFLSSMAQQYSSRGLRVAVVDATVLVHGSQPSHDAVLNADYDWQLKFQLLLDKNAGLARTLEVEEVPTTFLISADGKILHRWNGFSRPAVLALQIQKLVGGPLAQTP